MMGSSYSFIFTYILIDIMELLKEGLNYLHVHLTYYYRKLYKNLFGQVPAQKEKDIEYVPLVVINLQYFTLLLGTLFSGGFFGVLFGVIDIEKQFKNIFWLMMLVEAVEFDVFAPVGLLHGGTIGFFFMILRFCENKLRIEKQIFRSYGGTYIGYKDISLKSSDEEENVPILGDK